MGLKYKNIWKWEWRKYCELVVTEYDVCISRDSFWVQLKLICIV